jgi:hypothetical protein
MAELKINDIIVSISNNRIVLEKSAYPFDSWTSKFVPRSKTLKLAETNELNFIFGSPKKPEIQSEKGKKYYDFTYSDNGKPVFQGKLKLLKSNSNDQFEVQLLDESIEFFKDITSDLNQLSLDSEDFVFNSTEYNNKKQLNSSVWIWSAASNHEKKTLSNNILSGNLSFSRPFFSVQRLLEKIFTEKKWNYNLSSNTNDINKLILASNSDVFVFTSFESTYDTSIVVAGTHTIDILTTNIFLKTDSISGTTILQLNNKSKIRFRGNINSTADMKLRITGSTIAPADQLIEEFVINKGSFPYDLTSVIFETTAPTYDLTFEFIGVGTVTLSDFRIYTIIEENDFGNISAANFVDYKVKTYDNIPDVTQIDLFKNILPKFSGFFTSDNFRKEVNINSLNQISSLSVLDWTKKLNEKSISYIENRVYGKENRFKYDNDSSKPSNLGNGVFTIENNEVLRDLITIYKSIFAASTEVEIDTDIMIDNNIYDDTERINEINQVIGYYENVSTYSVARFENLQGNNILNNYYAKYLEAIKKLIIIECLVSLNKSDYFNFDFKRLVYFEQLQSSFYVLNISNYAEGRESKVKLLKI